MRHGQLVFVYTLPCGEILGELIRSIAVMDERWGNWIPKCPKGHFAGFVDLPLAAFGAQTTKQPSNQAPADLVTDREHVT